MALPASRNRTYVAGVTPVAAQDLNEIQDWIIDFAGRARSGTRTKIVGPEVMAIISGFTRSSSFPYLDLAISTTGLVYCPLPVEVGEVIQQVRVVAAALSTTVTDVNASLRMVNAASGAGTPGSETTLVANTNLPAAVGTIQKIVLSAGGPFTTVVDKHYYVRINGANTAGNTKQILRVEYDYTRP